MIWPRRCLHPETKITMADRSIKLLKDIKVGDQILSWNGKKFESDIVKNAWQTKQKPTLIIENGGGNKIITSHDHLFAVEVEPEIIEWKKASQLDLNSNMAMYVGLETKYTAFELSSINEHTPCELYDIETEKNHNFIANGYLVHNSGKDLVAFNLMLRAALKRVGIYFAIYPTYSQGRKILWQGMTNDSRKFLDFIPPELIANTNQTEMKIQLVNGSIIQLVGSSDKDKLVGTNPVGCLFSEFALSDPQCLAYIKPILAANSGWQMICSTPRGHNALYELYQIAQNNPEWYCSKLTLDDTRHISHALIEREIASGEISRDLAEQEYWTSFALGLEGSFYARAIDTMRLKERITQVPWESHLQVHTAWDIGLDTTAIIFFQLAGPTVRIIDYYENSNLSLDHYINVVKSKPYSFGKHVGPHDIANREFSSGVSRIDLAKNLGIKFVVAPNLSIPDGIEAVRAMLSRTWIDEGNCKQLIRCLENYRQEYDEKRKVYTGRAYHDIHSHGADSARYLAIYLPKLSNSGLTAEELDKRFNEARGQRDLPRPFQDIGNNFQY